MMTIWHQFSGDQEAARYYGTRRTSPASGKFLLDLSSLRIYFLRRCQLYLFPVRAADLLRLGVEALGVAEAVPGGGEQRDGHLGLAQQLLHVLGQVVHVPAEKYLD